MFLLAQIIVNIVLVRLILHPALVIADLDLFFLIVIITVTDFLFIFYFLEVVRENYISLYSRETEQRCQELVQSYRLLGEKQTRLSNEAHDIINAQFTYHSLLNAGEPDQAEAYRIRKQNEWSQES